MDWAAYIHNHPRFEFWSLSSSDYISVAVHLMAQVGQRNKKMKKTKNNKQQNTHTL